MGKQTCSPTMVSPPASSFRSSTTSSLVYRSVWMASTSTHSRSGWHVLSSSPAQETSGSPSSSTVSDSEALLGRSLRISPGFRSCECRRFYSKRIACLMSGRTVSSSSVACQSIYRRRCSRISSHIISRGAQLRRKSSGQISSLRSRESCAGSGCHSSSASSRLG
jgi:hypothetical protein